MAVGQWFQIPNTALSGVAPSPVPLGGGPQNKVDAWTSFVVDYRNSKVYTVANGGHGDYAGNEVDALTLESETPSWTQVLPPTPNAQITGCTQYYADGRPTARHTYYGVTLDETNNRIMLFGGDGYCVNGGSGAATDSYNIGSNSYSPAGTHPAPVAFGPPGVSVDPATGNVYLFGNFQLHRWNRAVNTYTQLSPSGTAPFGSEALSAMDTQRGRILVVSGLNQDHHLYSLGTNAWSTVTLTGANAPTVQNNWPGAMIYVPGLDRFLVRHGGSGGTVYQINPVTFAVTTASTTAGGSIPATLNGPYNKFLYVPRLGGAIYVPTYSGNAWFLRLH